MSNKLNTEPDVVLTRTHSFETDEKWVIIFNIYDFAIFLHYINFVNTTIFYSTVIYNFVYL